MRLNPLSSSSEAFSSNRVDFCCFIKSTYFSFKSVNSLVLCSNSDKSSFRESTSSCLGILEYTSFSSSESDSASDTASDDTVATNPTAALASSSASSLSEPDSLSKSSQVAIKLFLICFLNLLELKLDFLDLPLNFSF